MIVGTYTHTKTREEEVRITFSKDAFSDVALAVIIFQFMKNNPKTYLDINRGIEIQLNSLIERYNQLLNPQ
jgi:hypothetical protein